MFDDLDSAKLYEPVLIAERLSVSVEELLAVSNAGDGPETIHLWNDTYRYSGESLKTWWASKQPTQIEVQLQQVNRKLTKDIATLQETLARPEPESERKPGQKRTIRPVEELLKEDYVDTAEAAAIYGCTNNNIYWMRSKRTGPPVYEIDGKLLYKPQEVLAHRRAKTRLREDRRHPTRPDGTVELKTLPEAGQNGAGG